ncbi:hypothetical protein [Bdellovibrio bacteriovorus]|uniref:hypothetical protein n=1 Tax=Bdellovibrio bacteriovorus TaxID=959 RepID=UPI0012DAC992|nr:hypothetical protein [Bdellovibrio bacteriovorus]
MFGGEQGPRDESPSGFFLSFSEGLASSGGFAREISFSISLRSARHPGSSAPALPVRASCPAEGLSSEMEKEISLANLAVVKFHSLGTNNPELELVFFSGLRRFLSLIGFFEIVGMIL